MADQDVTDMLMAWGLETYVDIFKEHGIDISCLTLLTDEMMKEIIPMIGHRAKFKINLEEWRKVITLVNNEYFNNTGSTDSHAIIIDIPTTLPVLPTYNTPYREVTEVPSVQVVSNCESVSHTSNSEVSDLFECEPSTSSLQYCEKATTSAVGEKPCDLLNYLKKNTEGKALLSIYTKLGLLDNSGRGKLCQLIVRKELQDDPDKSIKTERLLALSQEIVEVFPKEHISTYFIPYVNYGALMKKAAKGKLLDCFNNRRREYKKTGIIVTTRRSPTEGPLSSYQTTKDNENVDDELEWLNNSSDPWSLVEKYWAITRDKRLKSILGSNVKEELSDYMKKFPALKKPSGYKLLIEDFNSIYPVQKDGLFEYFPLFKDKILNFGKNISKTLKDSTLKCIIDEYLDLAQQSEETSTLAAFLILPFLFFPVTTKRKKEAKDGFITHLQSHSELHENITRRKENYAQLGVTLQPLIIIVGPNINEILQYFVLVDGTY
ncbi:SAM domain-containing protein [Aphis craccivora]|uniref:SAM domain-containing protein n=1 Tax=Aphis craccivora TaxID=307492 RepID=A0A6G0Y1M4_APHCR|nr:SAM domain-containing protein [Aphis craccivora]